MEAAVHGACGQPDREHGHERRQPGQQPRHHGRLRGRDRDVRGRKRRTLGRARLQDPVRQAVDGAGFQPSAGRREQVPGPLHGEVDEEQVAHQEREHQREQHLVVVRAPPGEVQQKRRSVDDPVVREVGGVQGLGESQVGQRRGQRAAGLAAEQRLLPAHHQVVEVRAGVQRLVQQRELRVQRRQQQQRVPVRDDDGDPRPPARRRRQCGHHGPPAQRGRRRQPVHQRHHRPRPRPRRPRQRQPRDEHVQREQPVHRSGRGQRRD